MGNNELLFTPYELTRELPLDQNQKKFITDSRVTIQNILRGDDPRILLIVGPCSIHNLKSASEYAKCLKALSDEVSSNFFIVMRTYFEKPRTACGWKGYLYDPKMDESYDIENGLKNARKFLIELSDLKLPAAMEFLEPTTPNYISDLISWGCIGARTSESQTHRQIASSLDIPISFKNSTSGNVDVAINGILSAAISHTYIGVDKNGSSCIIKTKGNENCHLTLRGSELKPNYDPESILLSLKALKKANLLEQLLIDCSHGNSRRDPLKQAVVFQSVVHQIIEGNQNIKGMILESELYAGNQPILKDLTKMQYGVSVTDGCIDFATTKTLITWGFEKFKKNETLKAAMHDL